jgi:serine/threonine-protein kinase
LRARHWILSGLAALSLAWSTYQWQALGASDAFCAWGGGCGVVTDSAFARAVHARTRIPIPAWGAIWSAAALLLPLLAGAGAAGARPGGREPWWSATALLALGGVAAVAVLAAVSAQLGQLCSNCVISYLLVLAYAALCWSAAPRPGAAQLLRAAPATLGALGAATLLLLFPALRTPAPSAGLEALSREPAAPGQLDAELAELVQGLDAPQRHALAQALAAYAASPQRQPRAARALLGAPDAPVRLTEFVDLLCSHCASLHEVLAQLRQVLPPGVLAIESRHFPLDSSCNARIEPPSIAPVRCTAAKLLICMETRPAAFQLAGSIFQAQSELDAQRLFELAAPYATRSELDACIASPQTQARLQDDIGWALEHEIRGTPLVLINGRSAPSYPPFLLAIALARGDPRHPAFDALSR